MKKEELYESMVNIEEEFIEEADVHRVIRKMYTWKRSAAVAVLAVSFLVFSGIAANATSIGRIIQSISDWFGAALITEDNRDLIGKEVIDAIKPEISLGENNGLSAIYEDIIERSIVIDSVAAESIVLPDSVSEFEVKNNTIPEIIMTNGSMAVFYQNAYGGWNCKTGDTLSFSFEKYESDVIPNQTLVVGFIRDGVMYDGAAFRFIDGKYELEIVESGEYNIYVISATSDYLAIKQGTIEVILK